VRLGGADIRMGLALTRARDRLLAEQESEGRV